MTISNKSWLDFVERLSKINQSAADAMMNYINANGFYDRKALINYAFQVVQTYGNASATMAAMMYDAIVELEGLVYPAAELSYLPDYGDVAKTVNGVLKTSLNEDELAGAIYRLVKMVGQDTLLYNANRDRAQFAWIPSGDTCAFCIMLASRGWQNMSKNALKNGHAEHIHSNCDCTYMIRHTSDLNIQGYDPEEYREMYDANPGTPEEKLNAMRRQFYQENRIDILEQKKSAYEKRKELENTEAEEI